MFFNQKDKDERERGSFWLGALRRVLGGSETELDECVVVLALLALSFALMYGLAFLKINGFW